MILRKSARMAAVMLALIFSALAARADIACVRQVKANLAMNGIVAPGAAGTGACSANPVWPGISPVKMAPVGAAAGASNDAYLYAAFNPATARLFIGVDVANDGDFSERDKVLLFFDANNSNSWDTGDFAIRVSISTKGVSPTDPPAVSGSACAQTGRVEYFKRGTAGWQAVQDTAVLNQIEVRSSYDLETAVDSDTNLWNAEISIPAAGAGATYFPLTITGNYFGMGAYVFRDDGYLQVPVGTVFKWPAGITAAPGIADWDPAFSEPAASEIGDISLQDTCYDVNFNVPVSWDIQGVPAAENGHAILRNAENRFGVTFYYDGPGTTPQSLPNKGTVRLSLTPYRASGPGTAWVKDLTVTPESTKQQRRVEFVYDFAHTDPAFGSTGNIDFICATATLVNFARNDITSNDSHNVNHNYFKTSAYSQSLLLSGDALPKLRPGESVAVYLQVQPRNEARQPSQAGNVVVGSVPWLPAVGPGWWWGAAIAAAFLIALAVVRRARARARAWSLAAAAVVLLGCMACPPRQKVRWSIPGADKLGLRPLPGKPNWYQVPLQAGERKTIQFNFAGLPLPYKTVHHKLTPADANGRPQYLDIPVRSGTVLTVIGLGNIDPDGDGPMPPVSAAGSVRQLRDESPYPLRRGYYVPSEHHGALVGSFDDFKTAFVIGESASILVPSGAQQLRMAVNVPASALTAMHGFFDVATIETPPPQMPAHTVNAGDATYNIPMMYPIWDILTSINVQTYYEVTPPAGPTTAVRGRTRIPWGDAHFTVYESHQ